MSRPDLLPHVRTELQQHHDTQARLLAATRRTHRPLLGDVLQALLLIAGHAARLTAAATVLIAGHAARLTAAATVLVAGVASAVAYLYPVPLP